MTRRRPSTRFVPLSEGQHALALAALDGREALAALLARGEAPDGWAAEARTFRVPRSAWALRRAAQWALFVAEERARATLPLLRRGLAGAANVAASNAARYAAAAEYLAEAARAARARHGNGGR